MTDDINSEPAGWPTYVAAVIAGGIGWSLDLGWAGIVFSTFGGWSAWTVVQWMDMTTGRLMRIEHKLDELDKD